MSKDKMSMKDRIAAIQNAMLCFLDGESKISPELRHSYQETVRRLKKYPVFASDNQNVTEEAAIIIERQAQKIKHQREQLKAMQESCAIYRSGYNNVHRKSLNLQRSLNAEELIRHGQI